MTFQDIEGHTAAKMTAPAQATGLGQRSGGYPPNVNPLPFRAGKHPAKEINGVPAVIRAVGAIK